MYPKELEELIDHVLADGVITAKEREVLHRRAEAEGINADELDVLIDGRLVKEQQTQEKSQKEETVPVKWTGEQKDFPRVSELLEGLLHVRRSMSDPKLCLLRMKSTLSRFPVPKEQNEIVQFLTLCIPFTKKKSKSLFGSKREKEDTDWHNKMIDAWMDKCTEVILEARLEHINDEQALRVFDEYAQQLGI